MAKLLFVSILLVSLAASVSMQTYDNPLFPGMQQSNGILSGLLGGNSNGGGIGETIRQLPARGMQMLNNVFSGVRNMLPNLGRNNNMGGLMNNMQNPLNNMQNPLNNMQNPLNNMQNPLSNLQNLARPITDALGGQQGPLNNLMNQLTNGQTMNNMQNPLNNMQNPLNNMQNPLSNLQNNLPNLQNLARPVTDALRQGQLPSLNDVAQGITRTISNTAQNLANQAHV